MFHFLVFAYGEIVKLSGNGPVVLGGSITFKADLYNKDGSRPHSTYRYQWSDNGLFNKHQFLVSIFFFLIFIYFMCNFKLSS